MKKTILSVLAFFAISAASAQTLPAYKAYFPLNGTVKDSTGNTSGAKKIGAINTFDRNGIPNRALKFDGTNIDYVDLNDSFSSRSTTLSVWLNPDSVSPAVNPVIVLSNLANITQFTGTGVEVYLYNNRKIEVLVGNVTSPSTSLKRFMTKSTIPFKKWTHFALVIDSMQTIKLYINCKRDTTYSMSGLPAFTPSKYKMHIGARAHPHYENPFSGKLDEIKIFNRVLTDNQVTGIYKNFMTTALITACNKYVFRGKTYTATGVYNDTLTNVYGCDSIVSLNLKINKSSSKSLSFTACDKFMFKGKPVTSTGIRYDTLSNAVGCDSIVTYNIKINKSSGSAKTLAACNAYFFNGNTITTSGIYYDTLLNYVNCDSLITLNLTVNKSTSGNISITACNTFFFNGSKRISSGIYRDTLTNMKGCDSFLTLNLTINKSNSGSFSITTCNGYIFNGKKITTPGIYYDTLQNYYGCDSFLTLNLKINTPSSGSINRTACNGYFFGGRFLTAGGVYKDTIQNVKGCDSVITLNLTVNNVNTDVIQSSNILTAVESGAVYQWVDCAKGFSIIPLETKQSFSAKVNGSYAVVVVKNNCMDTSSCFAVTSLGLSQQSLDRGIKVYPNPGNGNITVDMGDNIQIRKIIITNIVGQTVYENEVRQQQIQISVDGGPGIYFMTVINADNTRSNIKLLIR